MIRHIAGSLLFLFMFLGLLALYCTASFAADTVAPSKHGDCAVFAIVCAGIVALAWVVSGWSAARSRIVSEEED